MSQAVRMPLTVADFLDWADRQEGDTRYELVRGEPVAMAPETGRHVRAKYSAYAALRAELIRGDLDCEVLGDGIGVSTVDQTLRQPDFSVHCGGINENERVFNEPVIVGEVLSPSSHKSDTGQKLAEYFEIPSVRHYLIIDPIAERLIVHSRASEEGPISTRILGRLDHIELDPPGIAVEVGDLLATR